MLEKKEQQKYNPQVIEPKWQEKWQEWGIYRPDMDKASKQFYNLMMFPYPSAEGLHVGNMYAFTGTDIYGRFKRMQGTDVFEPIGLDGFGIHSENYALKVGRHPKEQAAISEKNFYRQLHATGNGFDWTRTVETYNPDYYKWTQWLFTELFKAGLAYRKKQPVNFCPSCKTVLADEQVIDGKCERCGSVVEKRELEQWFFRITEYAEPLLQNIEKLNWSEKVKIAQRNWIGKSEGARIRFKMHDSGFKEEITVFTTRPDTLYGATFLVISPEHPVVASINDLELDDKIKASVKVYVERVVTEKPEERVKEDKEKTGVFSGLYALHPLTGEKLPIWIADYVLMEYGTGAIMAVPAHDQRDFEFAKKYELPIKHVIQGEAGSKKQEAGEEVIREGKLMNSSGWNGLEVPKEMAKVIDDLEKHGVGKREVRYHLRDWLISRQRYWGPPIPMVFCEQCAKDGQSWFTTEEAKKIHDSGVKIHHWESAGWYPVEKDKLPVLLPDVKEYKPMGTGKSPLAHYPEFYEVSCPGCGGKATRETDVSDTFLDSAWYFFRYTSTELDNEAFSKERVAKWLPVNMYIGGAEHSVLHLLYARFITHFLKDQGYITFDEPFARFYAHGLLIKEGAKMSKSKGNVIVPDQYIAKYGTDTLRSYLMFLGPFSQGGDFRDSGIDGMNRFLKRVWKLVTEYTGGEASSEAHRMMHHTIKRVSEDMERLHYNTAIAGLMEYYNFLAAHPNEFGKEQVETFLLLLAPFAPHMTEELWHQIHASTTVSMQQSIHIHPWPTFDPNHLTQEEVTIVLQVNGKMRDTITMSIDEAADQKRVEAQAKTSASLKKHLEGKSAKHIIYVKNKILNFVVA